MSVLSEKDQAMKDSVNELLNGGGENILGSSDAGSGFVAAPAAAPQAVDPVGQMFANTFAGSFGDFEAVPPMSNGSFSPSAPAAPAPTEVPGAAPISAPIPEPVAEPAPVPAPVPTSIPVPDPTQLQFGTGAGEESRFVFSDSIDATGPSHDGEEAQTAEPTDAAPSLNPLMAEMEAAEQRSLASQSHSVLSKPPICVFGGKELPIDDPNITLDELRKQLAYDFSELDNAAKVTYRVKYGKVERPIPNPAKTVIAKLKQEIESSKDFLLFLQKAKPEAREKVQCCFYLTVSGDKKGIASYKGVCLSLEEADDSEKAIVILPGRDGSVYQMRNLPIGKFITPLINDRDLEEIKAGFTPALPRIPYTILSQVISFFRGYIQDGVELEAMVKVYWDTREQQFMVQVPKQSVSKGSVDAISDNPDPGRFVLYADIHSHNTMAARFSSIDNQNERGSMIYVVIGRLHQYFPEITVRAGSNGHFLELAPSSIFEDMPGSYPSHWKEYVSVSNCRYAA